MTIPTRPAPPPPGRNQTISQHSVSSTAMTVNKKPAPPRPPPPKVLASAPVKKSGSQKSISILSNLFGASKNSSKTTSQFHTSTAQELRIPPKIPAPPAPKTHHNTLHQSVSQPTATTTSDVQLINFDEWPSSSPPSIKKSNTGSDSVSMDSFCSSTSSPNNLGAASQAER
jgi:hypothetical protein